jgi:hypothetical protein
MKAWKFFCLFLLFGTRLFAQDAVLISEGNFVRGVIQGHNFVSVAILNEDQTVAQYQAKDIQSFLWNGETFVSKPIVVKKKMEYRFFKVVEMGKVNLYTYGDLGGTPQPVAQPRVKVRPSVGIGVGSGGYGGGLGGGISIGLGGGRRDTDQPVTTAKVKLAYFIEKPGTGPMQEIAIENTTAVRNILLQKLNNDEDLAQSIKATESFDAAKLTAYIKAWNEMHK